MEVSIDTRHTRPGRRGSAHAGRDHQDHHRSGAHRR
jgi:hypothetical protein